MYFEIEKFDVDDNYCNQMSLDKLNKNVKTATELLDCTTPGTLEHKNITT